MNFNKNPVESLSSDLKTARDMRKVILFSEISLFLFKKLKKKGENPFYSFLFWGKMLSPYCLEPYGRCSKVPPPTPPQRRSYFFYNQDVGKRHFNKLSDQGEIQRWVSTDIIIFSNRFLPVVRQ